MARSFIWIFLLTVSAFAPAQTTSGWTAHYSAGFCKYNFSALAPMFPAYYPDVMNTSTCAGLGGFFMFRNYIIGAEFFGTPGEEIKRDSISLRSGVGEIKFNFGYIIYSSDKWLIYPIAGLGTAGRSYYIKHYDLLKHRGILYESDISSLALAVSSCLAAERGIHFGKSNHGLLIGLRSGATYGFPVGPWKRDKREISAPKKDLFGFYGTITLGIGRWTKA